MMMLWKSVITKQFPFSTAMPPLAFAVNVKSHITQFPFSNFCTEIAPPFTTPPGRGVVTEFLINRCGLTDEEITKAFRCNNKLFCAKSGQNLEKVLELLKSCGVTTPAQIRRAVICNPSFFFRSAESNIQSKLSLFRSFMKEEDISKLVTGHGRIFRYGEDKLKAAISLLQRLGVNDETLSRLLATKPRFLAISEAKVMESFKLAEDFGFNKETKLFAAALRSILGLRKEVFERRLQCLSCLGFSEEQISEMWRRRPDILGYSEEKLKRLVDFLVKSAGLTIADFVRHPNMFSFSLEKRAIPRYRVMQSLKSMRVLKTEIHFLPIFRLSAKRFLEIYVDSNAESSALRDIYHRVDAGKLSIDKKTSSESYVGPRLEAMHHTA